MSITKGHCISKEFNCHIQRVYAGQAEYEGELCGGCLWWQFYVAEDKPIIPSLFLDKDIKAYMDFLEQHSRLAKKYKTDGLVSQYITAEKGKCFVEGKLRIVTVVDIKPDDCHRGCGCTLFWTYIDEPDLFRCCKCFPRPNRSSSKQIKDYLFLKHLRVVSKVTNYLATGRSYQVEKIKKGV